MQVGQAVVLGTSEVERTAHLQRSAAHAVGAVAVDGLGRLPRHEHGNVRVRPIDGLEGDPTVSQIKL